MVDQQSIDDLNFLFPQGFSETPLVKKPLRCKIRWHKNDVNIASEGFSMRSGFTICGLCGYVQVVLQSDDMMYYKSKSMGYINPKILKDDKSYRNILIRRMSDQIYGA